MKHQHAKTELLLRAANDTARPMSIVEVALKVRPAGESPLWRLDPQYETWGRQSFPSARFCFCPLPAYDRLVRPADAGHSLEALDALLHEEVARTGGYVLEGMSRWRSRTAMFAVGSASPRALIEFLFTWS